eukprot:gene6165-6006_t
MVLPAPILSREPDPHVSSSYSFSHLFGHIGCFHLSHAEILASLEGPPPPPNRPPPPRTRDSAPAFPVCALQDSINAGLLAPGVPRLFGNIALTWNGKKWCTLFDARLPNSILHNRFSTPTPTRFVCIYDLIRCPQRFPSILSGAACRQPFLFLKTDITNAYHSVRLPPEFQDMFGFLHRGRSFVFLVLPFGFSGAPYILQTLVCDAVDTALRALRLPTATLRSLIVLVQLDDILTAHPDQLTLRRVTEAIRSELRRRGFVLRP